MYNNKPLISCITPTFNRSHLLRRAIESTINQTYTNWELIIVDDNSEDNTEEVVRRYIERDERIKYFKNPGEGGNAARNHGIRKAEGKWIAFLDDDVENLPERFELQLDAVQKSGSRFILSGFISVNRNGKESIVNDGLWGIGAGITSRWFISKELLVTAGLFDEEMPSMQECELSYRIASHETFANHFKLVTREYQSNDSVSKGINGIRGTELLLDKQLDKMDKSEAAWWYFKIGRGYLSIGGYYSQALKNFKQAADLQASLWYRVIYFYVVIFGLLNFGLLKRINGKVVIALQSMINMKRHNHPVIQ
jgi:glycosyltransferase involved in cell wall biosynthesis